MRYRLEIKDEAREQLHALPKEQRRNIGYRLNLMQNDLAGDVRKLAARVHEYRLRVGGFRVLFMLEEDLIVVYSVKIERMRMSDVNTLEKPTLESSVIEVRRIQERLEDMEDLMDLRAAVERNAGKPGTPWEEVKAELDID